ncbi:Uncharacterized protein dnl_31690 [Desulfonema limicola]|uniref:Uncharacterized protein n=1 Tax=Desulfonema limicola TaxID=45656 RepID=A0A975B8Y5_9BACT|nr:Uncharacterized protein dnl_31690 [Desulfonema limicola]
MNHFTFLSNGYAVTKEVLSVSFLRNQTERIFGFLPSGDKISPSITYLIPKDNQ